MSFLVLGLVTMIVVMFMVVVMFMSVYVTTTVFVRLRVLSFMMVSLFVSVMMFMLVHQALQAGWWGPGQGEIFPENTGEKCLVLTGEPGGGGWQETK